MSGKCFFLVVVLVIVGMLLGACDYDSASADSGSETKISFKEESDPSIAGAYLTMNIDGSIDDLHRGRWYTGLHLPIAFKTCIVPIQGKSTAFYANVEKGWSWLQKTNLSGEICYKLYK